mmetsp:Transcript_84084/g.224765  ORF Transcript_84084/g.224765 Transcript_84084/m.224765 type:complete len:305 (-) Transcript_84084:125-1039(-)
MSYGAVDLSRQSHPEDDSFLLSRNDRITSQDIAQLLRPNPPRELQERAVNRTMHHAFVSLFQNVVKVFKGILVATLLAFFTVLAWSVYVLLKYRHKPCDKPLYLLLIIAYALLALNVMVFLVNPRSEEGPCAKVVINILRSLNVVASIAWPITGVAWLYESQTCAVTNPHIYYTVLALVILYFWFTLVLLLLPFVLVFLFMYSLRRGWLSYLSAEGRGAPEGTVESFDKYDVPVDPREIPEDMSCAICWMAVAEEPDKPMRITPCKHVFHEECMKNWLDIGRTCPICRFNFVTRRHDDHHSSAV